jgi:hypothetical protein
MMVFERGARPRNEVVAAVSRPGEVTANLGADDDRMTT